MLFNHTNLYNHASIILRWIRSCETDEQVDLLIYFINVTFVPGYEKAIAETKADSHVFTHDLQAYKAELNDAIEKRKKIIASK